MPEERPRIVVKDLAYPPGDPRRRIEREMDDEEYGQYRRDQERAAAQESATKARQEQREQDLALLRQRAARDPDFAALLRVQGIAVE